MKIRSGFVSNSSTSSFLIYGVYLDAHPDLDVISQIESIPGFEVIHPEYGWYIGRNPQSIRDDETGKEFKESVSRILSEKLGKTVACSYMEYAWYNG